MSPKANVVKKKDLTFTPRRGRRPRSAVLRDATAALYREHIRKVAEQTFAKQGFEQTRMQDIAAAAGISLGTLYQSYPAKRDLHRELMLARDEEMLNTVLTRGQSALQQPQSIEQMLWLQQASVGYLLEHHDYLRMLLHEGHAWYHRAAQPSSVEQQLWERGEMAIKAVLVWGTQQGVFVPGDTTDQARLLIAMQQTRLANWIANGMHDDHSIVAACIAADFVRQFCVPAVAARLLTADGSRLTDETIQRIHMYDHA